MVTKNLNLKNVLIYSLLLIPALSAILAITTGHFAWKAGVTGSAILILAAFFYAGHRKYEKVGMIIAAFLFSIAGDWFLSNKQEQSWMFMAGIAFFFFAHICYLIYALKNGKINQNLLIVVLAIFLILFFGWLTKGIAGLGLKSAVLCYLVISCVSLSAAAGMNKVSMIARYAFTAGISLILFSDTIIAFKEFTMFQALNFLILPTYYLSHLCIAFSLMVTMRNQGSTDS
jgi:uncharacterized membrane protein YhhN